MKVIIANNDIRYGFHVSTAGKTSWVELFTRLIENTPLQAYQIYLASGHSKQKPACNPTDIIEARKLLDLHQRYLSIHASLLYNPCGSVTHIDDPDFARKWESTITALTAELDIATGFGAGCVLHIGSCRKKEAGYKTITDTLVRVLTTATREAERMANAEGVSVESFIKRRRVILENSAGEGTKYGSTLEDIAVIIGNLPSSVRGQVTVCIDTAHLCGAGKYDVGDPTSTDLFYDDFERLIGLDKLELFHLNDSLVPMGSKKDRHANLGHGYLFGDLRSSGNGEEGLRHFILRAREAGKPMIGEPPNDGIEDWYYVHEVIVSLFE